MDERIELIKHLESYAEEIAMTSDTGYHLRQLLEALEAEEESEQEG